MLCSPHETRPRPRPSPSRGSVVAAGRKRVSLPEAGARGRFLFLCRGGERWLGWAGVWQRRSGGGGAGRHGGLREPAQENARQGNGAAGGTRAPPPLPAGPARWLRAAPALRLPWCVGWAALCGGLWAAAAAASARGWAEGSGVLPAAWCGPPAALGAWRGSGAEPGPRVSFSLGAGPRER